MSTSPVPSNSQMVTIKRLQESPRNPRKSYDAAKLAELTESVKSNGILVPLLCRPWHELKPGASAVESGYLEILAGSRRFKAASTLKLTEIPVIVRDLSDQQALEIQLIDNLQRDDPHPLEEADGYAGLMSMDGYTLEIIAEKVSKPQQYITTRMQLLKLIEVLKKDFYEGMITLGHALVISRHSEADQETIRKEMLYTRQEKHVDGKWVKGPLKAVSVSRLLEDIGRNLLTMLVTAPWDLNDGTLVPKAGSCNDCPKRSNANRALFTELTPEDDRCLDRKCFQTKLNAHVQRTIAANPDLVKIGGHSPPKGAIANHQYRNVEKKPCQDTKRAIIVDGHQVGHQIDVCTNQKCKQHWGSYGHGGERAVKSSSEQLAAAKTKLSVDIVNKSRYALFVAVDAAMIANFRVVPKSDVPESVLARVTAEALLNRLTWDDTKEICKYLGIERKKGTYSGEATKQVRTVLDKAKGVDFARLSTLFALVDESRPLQYYNGAGQAKSETPKLERVAAVFKVNVAKVRAGVEKELRDKYEKKIARLKGTKPPKKVKPTKKAKVKK